LELTERLLMVLCQLPVQQYSVLSTQYWMFSSATVAAAAQASDVASFQFPTSDL